ncbi:dihydrolipoyl dehydrogenase [candidate division KSB1 bacterium]|nr:dihydrolipoyl dehydrogenase [candidate division KSB1 bacterium]MBL7094576.1 dihydrolipoyl dehydrogenase [candidate division KSB1 bacterium]
MNKQNFDFIVIGSGPGGYVAAIRASQLGKKVAVVEKEHVGGICLNWGCIPTKALMKSAETYSTLKQAKKYGFTVDNFSYDFGAIIKRSRQLAGRMSKGVQFLFKKNDITVIMGTAKLAAKDKVLVSDASGEITDELTADKIIIATGARPRSIPGIEIDRKRIITSREAMSLEKMPESMIVIGAGAIGIEFAYFYQTLGCHVTIVEMLPNILPIEDKEITDVLTRSFKKYRSKIHTNSMVKSVQAGSDNVSVTIESNGESTELEAELALMAIGVQGNIEGLGLEDLGVEIDLGYIKVDDSFQTNIENVYAIGDIIGPPWLAHVASAEGINAVEKMAGMDVKPIDYSSIPGCTYCKPQVASIGLTEEKALEAGYVLKIGRFPFVANGRSLAAGESEGLVKLIFDERSNKLLGAHIIHAEATELIGELSVLKTLGIEGHDLIKTIHAHPTLSEAIMEAGAAAYDEAIHV